MTSPVVTPDAAAVERPGLIRRPWSSPVAWTWTALVVSILFSGSDDASDLAGLLLILFGGYLLFWRGAHRWGWREKLAIPRWMAPPLYIGLGVLGGIMYELTLDGGGGYGGLASDAAASFLLLPGYLVPAVLMTWWMTRRYGFDARQLFFVAGIMAWYEVLTVGLAVMVGVPILAPPLLAFYVASYAVYNGAFGLLVIRPEALWASRVKQISFRRSLVYGVIAGALAWVCFLVWAGLLTAGAA